MARPISLASDGVYIAPSILSADPLDMSGAIGSLEGLHDWLHVDIMDGHFVPNLSYGPALVRSLRERYHDEVLDVHLMVEPPESFIDIFLDHDPDVLTVHCEATPHLHRVLGRIRERGVHPGVSLNPGTPVSAIEPVLSMVDLVLVMSVNPGFGGQAFIPETLSKVVALCRMRAVGSHPFLIQMDGGIGSSNLDSVVRSGVDVVVMGNSVFSTPCPGETVKTMKTIALEAFSYGKETF
ncbi:MAG: ribulose-phosphate 3-epimerase [Dethiosulfovibrio peptidovorans]|nr:MAG: ribulose-phosphate 3-epimerase [Dethiosulfovibrio peptidovorans]